MDLCRTSGFQVAKIDLAMKLILMIRAWMAKILLVASKHLDPVAAGPHAVISSGVGHRKVFIIGYNKTGTTSLKNLFLNWGFAIGNEAVGHLLTEDWLVHGRTDRILKYTETAQVFQDKPFSTDGLFRILDAAYPDALFVLSVRDNADVWYASWLNHHKLRYSGDSERLPTLEELQQDCSWLYKGYVYDSDVMQWGRDNLYNEDAYKKAYLAHIEAVRTHFAGQSSRFLEICLSRPEDLARLKTFLGIENPIQTFPHENKTIWPEHVSQKEQD